MRTLQGTVAAWSQAGLSSLGEAGRLHLADDLLALVAGRAAQVAGPDLDLPGAGALDGMAADVAAMRSTEIDDIHLPSCVTPGAVVVPALLGLLRLDRVDPGAFGPALVAGYEAAIGFGLGLGGASALYGGVWPTLAVAPLAAAATTARAIGLPPQQTMHALAIAAPFCGGRIGHAAGGPTNRWIAAGEAVRVGMNAAFAARAGYVGALDHLPVFDGREEGRVFETTSFKPFCAAKQTIAAVSAFQKILADGARPEAMERITVRVPAAYRNMIAAPPASGSDRLGSITSIAYQIALAAHAPWAAYRLDRVPLQGGPDVAATMAAVEVEATDQFDSDYPDLWPAEVLVTAGGVTTTHTVKSAPGDPGTAFERDDLIEKSSRILSPTGNSDGRHLLEIADRLVDGADVTLEVLQQFRSAVSGGRTRGHRP